MLELDRWSYVDAYGSEHLLHDPRSVSAFGSSPRIWVAGVLGTGAVGRSFVEENRSGQAGTRIRGKPYQAARDVDLLVHFEAATDAEMQAVTRAWVRWLVTDGPGLLRYYSAAGMRQIEAYYTGGLEVDQSGDGIFRDQLDTRISFHCPDPYWTTAEEVSPPPYAPASTRPFFPMTDESGNFALNLAPSFVQKADTVRNDGDVEAYPRWSILGPGGPVILRNKRTDRTLAWNGTLAAGQTLVLDTDPDRGTARLDDGTSVYADLADDADFWPLPPGISDVDAEAGGSTPETRIRLAYRLRFASA